MFDDILCTHYILIYSTHNGDDAPQKSVRITSRVSFLCIPVQWIISKDYVYFYHKYVSTSHRIVHAFTRHLLDPNTYTSTVMQYTTRHLSTGTACISHLHTPHQHGSPSYLDTFSVSLSPLAFHRRTQPGHRTRAPPQLRNLYLSKPLTWFTQRTTDPQKTPELQGIEPLSGIEVYTMNAQPSPPGSHRSYRYGHK